MFRAVSYTHLDVYKRQAQIKMANEEIDRVTDFKYLGFLVTEDFVVVKR